MKVTLERVNQFLLFAILLTVALFFARQILMPIALACMLAMLMAPICRWLDGKGFPRTLSALSCVLVLLVFMVGVLAIVSVQIVSFSQDIPLIEKKATMVLNQVQEFVQAKFNVSPEEQLNMVKKQISQVGKSAGSHIGKIIGGVTGTIATLVLTLVFTFLLLFNKERYENFFVKLYKEEESKEVRIVLADITKVSQAYLTGRAISMLIQAVLFSIGLTIIGVKNGVLLGCIAALLSILPFVGPFVGGLFPVMMTLLTEESFRPTLFVIILLLVIQVIDNYFIEPNVVGGKINLNALVTIIIIIIGGTIWGVVGMVLFTPILGIAKIIFDHVNELKPYAYLIGNDQKDSTTKFSDWLKGSLKMIGLGK